MSIEKIAKQLIRQKEAGQPTILFLGAGVSVTAGVPTVPGIIHYVRDSSSFDYLKKSKYDNYFDLMSNMFPGDRKKVLDNFIDQAKVNISHIIVGFLISEGLVDCAITTNFDPLIDDATTLFYRNPQKYDIANNVSLSGHNIALPSIIYLHGEYRNVWQLNTKSELQKNVAEINTVTSQMASKQATWIIVGYSGKDRVFDALAKIPQFSQGLYWISYKEEPPTTKVQNQLLSKPNNNAKLVSGYDSDTFFKKLFKNLIKYGNTDIERLNNKLSNVLLSQKQLQPNSIGNNEVSFTNQISLTSDCQEWIKETTRAQPSYRNIDREKESQGIIYNLGQLITNLFSTESKRITNDIRSRIKNKEWEEALELCNIEIKGNPDTVLAYYFKGIIFGEMGKNGGNPYISRKYYIQMVSSFDKAKTKGKDKNKVWRDLEYISAVKKLLWQKEHNRGVNIVTNDNLKTILNNPTNLAMQHLTNATIIQPDNSLSWNVLAQISAMNESFKDAAKAKKKYISMVEQDTMLEPNDYLQLASYYFQADNNPKVVSALESGTEQFPDNQKLVSNLADAYQRAGEPEKAISTVRRLVEENPEDPQFHLVLGTQIYQRALVLNDSLSANYDEIFDLQQKMRNSSDAEKKNVQQQIETLEQGNEQLEPKVKELTDEAEKELKTVIEYRPDDDTAYNTLGIIYQNRAKAIFDKRNQTVDDEKAAVLDEKGKEMLKEATVNYKKATEIKPKEKGYWKSLYSIYVALGMDNKAHEAQNRIDNR